MRRLWQRVYGFWPVQVWLIRPNSQENSVVCTTYDEVLMILENCDPRREDDWEIRRKWMTRWTLEHLEEHTGW